VVVYSGDAGINEHVGDFFIKLVTTEWSAIGISEVCDSAKGVRKLNDVERQRLDSVLIYEPNNLWPKYLALQACGAGRMDVPPHSRACG